MQGGIIRKSPVWLFNDRTGETMPELALIKLISNALKITAMGFFAYSAYQGAFNARGSTTVFVGVAVLTMVIVLTHIFDDMRQ